MKQFLILMVSISCLVACQKTAKVQDNPTIEDFKNEAVLKEISGTMEKFKALNPSKEPEAVLELRAEVEKKIKYLYKKYNVEQTKAYVKQLLKDAKEPDATNGTGKTLGCCKRQSNGAVDGSCCSFWENISVFLDSLGCPDAGTTKEQADAYYNCIQANVCDDC